MHLDLAFLCDAATESGGKLNALGIGIDRLTLQSLPQQHRNLAVVVRIAFQPGDEGDHALTLELIGPDGSPVVPTINVQLRVQPDTPRSAANVIVDIANASFTSAGPHEAKLTLDGNELAALPLDVSVQAPA